MLLPREEHIAIISQPLDHKPPKVSLDLLRVNQQLYQEVAEYFYANRTLYMLAARDKFSVMFSNEYISRYYEAIAAMGLQARQHFTKLEIQVGHLSEQVPVIRKHIHVPYSDSPMQNIMDLLPSLSFIVISVDHVSLFLSSSSLRLEQLCDTIEWLLSFIPDKIEVQWYFEKLTAVPPRTRGAREVLTAPITRRGPIVPGRSVLTRLRAEHDEKTRARQLAMLERLSNPSFQTVTSKPS